MERIYRYNLGWNPISIGTSTVSILTSIFGSKESPDQEFARWMDGWQKEIPPDKWACFMEWIDFMQKNNGWSQACDFYNQYGLKGCKSRQTGAQLMIQLMADQIKKRDIPCACRSDRETFDICEHVRALKGSPAVTAEPGAPPAVVKAGFGGLSLLFLGGLAAFLLFGRK